MTHGSRPVPKVAVVGFGSWGTAVCGLVAANARSVSAWAHSDAVVEGFSRTHENPRYLKGYRLPDNVSVTSDLAACAGGAEVVVLVVPSVHLRPVCIELAATLGPDVAVVVLTKGIERGTGLLMTDVAAQTLGSPERIGALSGPNHAEEVCQGKPAAAVLACGDDAVAERLRQAIIRPTFRVYRSRDVAGVETCGAVKNVMALACGIADGLGLGDNTGAVLMTRGLAEMTRVAVAMGADPMTPMGLAGMGDLVVTCTSPHSRNRSFGQALVAGESLEDYQRRTSMVVEGAVAAASTHELAARLGVDVPITDAVWRVLYDGSDVTDELWRLLDRPPQEEFYGIL